MFVCRLLGLSILLFSLTACNGTLVDQVKSTGSTNFCPGVRLSDGTCPRDSSGTRPSVSSVSIVNDQLVLSGVDLEKSISVKMTGENSFNEVFSIESKTSTKLVANSVKNISYVIGSIFNLIISDAQGATTFSVTFTLSDNAVVSSSILNGAITLSKLEPLTASEDGQVLYWNESASKWQTKSISGLTHKGSFDASVDNDQTSGLFDGNFYVCTTGGSFDPNSGSASGIMWAIGDWAVYDSATGWTKIAATDSVTSVAGKTGAVTLTWSDIAKTNSKLKDIANVDMATTAPTDGQYLVWDDTNSKWIPGDVTIGSGNISNNAVVTSSINAGAVTVDKVDLSSTTKGLGLPTMTSVQRSAMAAPTTGMIVYNSTTNKIETYNGTTWVAASNYSSGSDAYGYNSGASTDSVYVDGSGNVGIGTTSPGAMLEVEDSSSVSGTTLRISNAYGESPKRLDFYYSGGSSETARIEGYGRSSGSGSRGPNLSFSVNDGAGLQERLRIIKSGNVGIGTTTPGYKLDVQGGDINASGNVRAAGVALSSDRRWKKEIRPMKNALKKIEQLRGVSYSWNRDDFPDKHFSHRKQIGVIAQEVLEVFPEAVLEDHEGFYSVNYPALVAPLIEATKEQQTQIENNLVMFKVMKFGLQKQVDENSRKIASLKAENIQMKNELRELRKMISSLSKKTKQNKTKDY